MKLAVTEFLNTYPLIWYFEKEMNQYDIEITKTTPAGCASLLLQNKVEGGVMPISTYAYHQDIAILLNPCIASRGHVRTVKLYSNSKIDSIYDVVVDQDSRTSVILLKIILSLKYKKHKLTFFKGDVSEIKEINDEFGYMMIGDKNFLVKERFEYVYDLAAEWVEWVKLPIVFASWMLEKNIDMRKNVRIIKKAYTTGMANFEELCDDASKRWHLPVDAVKDYFKENLAYELGFDGVKAIKLFFEMAFQLKLLPKVSSV